MNPRKSGIYLVFFSFVFLFIQQVSASHPFIFAVPFSIDEKPKIGALIARVEEGYRLTNIEYDSKMSGVVIDHSDMVVEYDKEVQGVFDDRYLVDAGEADVVVNDSNGMVKKGEYITSSYSPGEGMRADQDGIVLGIALEDFERHTDSNTDLIRTAIAIKFTSIEDTFTAEALFAKYGVFGPLINTLLDIFKVAPDKLSQAPPFFRYALATLLLIAAVVFGFVLFGRVALRGIESLGRNPLARWTILSGILINITFILLMIGFAIFLAYIVLTL